MLRLRRERVKVASRGPRCSGRLGYFLDSNYRQMVADEAREDGKGDEQAILNFF